MKIDPAWGAMPPQWSIYFAVANVDETAALISRLGGKALGAVQDSPYGRIAEVADPSGAEIKVIQLSGR